MSGWGSAPYGLPPWGDPFAPPPTVVIIPTHDPYRVVVADLNGIPIDEVPAKNLAYSYVLNGPGAISFELGLEDPKTTPATLAVNQRELWVVREGTKVWGGYLWTAEASLDQAVVRFGGEGYWSRIRRLYLKNTLDFKQIEQLDIAWALINAAQSQSGTKIALTRYATANSGIKRDATYNAWEFNFAGQMVENLAALANGFDFDVTPDKRFVAYYPRRGGPTAWVLQLGKNIQGLSQTQDGTATATEITAIGSGSGSTTLLSTKLDGPGVTEFGLLQDTRSYTDVVVQQTLDDHATEDLRLAAIVRDQPVTNIIATIDIPFGSIVVGDEVNIRANRGYLQINKAYRVTSVAVSVSNEGEEAITFSFDEPI